MSKIYKIRVNARSSRNRIQEDEGSLKVYLTAPACQGLANEQLIVSLSEYLGVKKYNIKIKSGMKSRDKIVEINDGS